VVIYGHLSRDVLDDEVVRKRTGCLAGCIAGCLALIVVPVTLLNVWLRSIPPEPHTGPAQPCSAARLRGVLPQWVNWVPAFGQQGGPLTSGSLLGWVRLTNVSGSTCVLRGAPAVRLLDRGVPVALDYRRAGGPSLVVLGPGAAASFPVGWSPPYCPARTAAGPLVLRASLGGGAVFIVVTDTRTPPCTGGATHRGAARSAMYSGPVALGSISSQPGTGRLRGVSPGAGGYTQRIAPGQDLRFWVTLINPGSHPVSLAGLSALRYTVVVACDYTGPADGYVRTFRYPLGTSPHAAVPAQGTFSLPVMLPGPAACQSRRLSVTWSFSGAMTSFDIQLAST
jgi:hypothetical protein